MYASTIQILESCFHPIQMKPYVVGHIPLFLFYFILIKDITLVLTDQTNLSTKEFFECLFVLLTHAMAKSKG